MYLEYKIKEDSFCIIKRITAICIIISFILIIYLLLDYIFIRNLFYEIHTPSSATNVLLCIFIINFPILCMYFSRRNIDSSIKEKGEKVKAYIIDTGYRKPVSKNAMFADYNYYIEICYGKRNKRVYNIKYNKAYRIIEMLLNPYPIKCEVKIPINVYVYKNRIYADLKSLDIEKQQGFKEISKQ